MKPACCFVAFLLSMSVFAQKIPLVYDKENTGAKYPLPVLPALKDLPVVEPLPDPFMFSNSTKRSTLFKDWEKRRNEIRAEIEHYEIGIKPPKPQNITADYADSNLTVTITENGKSMKIVAKIVLPSNGKGPFPAVIGMNRPNGSLPADIFTSRDIAMISFRHNDVTINSNAQTTDPYYTLYPDLNPDNTGQYSAWAWGVSRIIDGIELLKDKLPIDVKHLAVTGCSYAGKMALIAGAFDERIALTIAQESGGGGATAWRVSETLGAVEKLGATSHQWFKEDMFDFANNNVSRLPHDHHELMAMVAPRALLVTGNTDYMWLANPSNYIASKATEEVYKQFGIGDRFGYYIDGNHGHCQIPESQKPAIVAFVDKFLLEKNVNTNVSTAPYPEIDYRRWTNWWGTAKAVFPPEPPSKKIWVEAECGIVGDEWLIETDTEASGKYVVSKQGMDGTKGVPKEAKSYVQIPFEIDSAGTYNILARINCATGEDDSFWIKLDDGGFENANSLITSGWQWKSMLYTTLAKGKHKLTFAYREDGAKLDKILVTTSQYPVTGKGGVDAGCSN